MFKKAPFVILLIINCGIHSHPTNITNSHEQESNFNSNLTETESTPKLDIPEENDEHPKESESSTPQFEIPEDESERKPSTPGYHTNKEDSNDSADWQVDPDLNASSTSQPEIPESESERNNLHSTDVQQVTSNSNLDASSTPQPKIPQGESERKPSTPGYHTNKEDSNDSAGWQVNPDLDWQVDPDLNASSTSQSEIPESESERNKLHSTDVQQVTSNSDLDPSLTPQPKIPQSKPKGKPSTSDDYMTIRIDLSQTWKSGGGAIIDLQNEGGHIAITL